MSDSVRDLAKPNFDALSQIATRRSLAQASATFARPGTKVQMDDRLGLPTFFWAAKSDDVSGMTAGKGQRKEELAARHHLEKYVALYRMEASDLKNAVLGSIHNTGDGAVIVRFRAALGGVDIFREQVNVAMDQQLNLISISGYLSGTGSGVSVNRSFALSPAQALARSVNDLLDINVGEASFMRAGTQGAYEQYTSTAAPATAGYRLLDTARVKRVYFRLPEGLEAAYLVQVLAAPATGGDSKGYAYVINASNGQLLFRMNQVASDAFTYRVWAETTGLRLPYDSPQGNSPTPKNPPVPDDANPPFVPSNLVMLQNGPISTNDPWLPPGATMTQGNNVEAFADLTAPDDYQPGTNDTFAMTTSANTFDHSYDPTLPPQASSEQIQASVTQLFYDINFFHDWYYDVGFKEVDGNAQLSNYGRGGLENDRMFAEAQDFAGRNNANMFTPSDGGRPRMRMYIFDGSGSDSITATGAVTGTFTSGTADFGPKNFNVTAAVARTVPADACVPATNDLTGKIAFVDRGTCTFVIKTKNAQLAGAAAVIIANVASSSSPGTAPGMTGVDATVVIPTLSLNNIDGDLFRTALDGGQAVSATLARVTNTDPDGGLDNQIVAHEWAHYISNRLVYDALGLNTNMAGGLGEGWADFHSMLLSVRGTDAATPSNAAFNGVYPVGAYATGDSYFGIRRVPYSTDFTKNPLTFKHIANGVPLPEGVPIAFGQDGSNNAEVHNAGEVWTTMLWESYAALLRDTLGASPRLTFAEARARMKKYIVEGYKMTPFSPTLLEARDAILTSAYATSKVDYYRIAAAFAVRGAGTGAVAPDRYSQTNTPGLVESFELGGELTFSTTTPDDSLQSCDADGGLDNREAGKLLITVKNIGALPLANTVATVTSTNPSVSYPTGNQVRIPASEPFSGDVSAYVPVRLLGASGISTLDFTVTLSDPRLLTGPVSSTIWGYGNYNVSATSTSDNVEAPVSAWTASGTGIGSWSRHYVGTAPLNYTWYGPDLGSLADRYLVSPALQVGAGNFSFSFSHRFSFEYDASARYDGGVVELSTDGGTTWVDIGEGYTGTVSTCCSSPIGGRHAYTGMSAGYPGYVSQTINLGTTYANQTVKIRFRLAEDEAIGADGWDIDDLVFTGLTNTPFTVMSADPGCHSVTSAGTATTAKN